MCGNVEHAGTCWNNQLVKMLKEQSYVHAQICNIQWLEKLFIFYHIKIPHMAGLI